MATTAGYATECSLSERFDGGVQRDHVRFCPSAGVAPERASAHPIRKARPIWKAHPIWKAP